MDNLIKSVASRIEGYYYFNPVSPKYGLASFFYFGEDFLLLFKPTKKILYQFPSEYYLWPCFFIILLDNANLLQSPTLSHHYLKLTLNSHIAAFFSFLEWTYPQGYVKISKIDDFRFLLTNKNRYLRKIAKQSISSDSFFDAFPIEIVSNCFKGDEKYFNKWIEANYNSLFQIANGSNKTVQAVWPD